MPRSIAVLDADVLVPVLLCDLLLTLFDSDLYLPVVSPTILAEVERNLVADFPHIESAALRRRVAHMSEALTFHSHSVGEIVPDALAGINRKDHHVAALAIAQGADVVVTNDRRLRREINSVGLTLTAVSADEFALNLLATQREKVLAVIDTLVAKRTRHPVTRQELIDRLTRSVPRFTAGLRHSE